MDKKVLFFCILILGNLVINASENTVSSISGKAINQEIYITSQPSSQNQLSELDPTARGNPFVLDNSNNKSSAVGSPVRLSPVTEVSVGNSGTEGVYGTNSPIPENEQEPDLMFITIICCPCFTLELFGFEKKNCCSCCSCCCSEKSRQQCFSCCMM